MGLGACERATKHREMANLAVPVLKCSDPCSITDWAKIVYLPSAGTRAVSLYSCLLKIFM